MKPAKNAVRRSGKIVLHKRADNPLLDIPFQLISLEKKAPLIAKQLRFDNQNLRKIRLNYLHLITFPQKAHRPMLTLGS